MNSWMVTMRHKYERLNQKLQELEFTIYSPGGRNTNGMVANNPIALVNLTAQMAILAQ